MESFLPPPMSSMMTIWARSFPLEITFIFFPSLLMGIVYLPAIQVLSSSRQRGQYPLPAGPVPKDSESRTVSSVSSSQPSQREAHSSRASSNISYRFCMGAIIPLGEEDVNLFFEVLSGYSSDEPTLKGVGLARGDTPLVAAHAPEPTVPVECASDVLFCLHVYIIPCFEGFVKLEGGNI